MSDNHLFVPRLGTNKSLRDRSKQGIGSRSKCNNDAKLWLHTVRSRLNVIRYWSDLIWDREEVNGNNNSSNEKITVVLNCYVVEMSPAKPPFFY